MGILLAAYSTVAQTNPQFQVNSKVDAHDANPGDGVCLSAAGECTLRAAIEENQANPDWGFITLPADDYVLTLGTLFISTSTTIQGNGPLTTRIDAGRKRGFIIGGSGGYNAFFSNFAIHNGFEEGDVDNGQAGAMFINPGNAVSLFRVNFTNNEASWTSGAILNGGTLTMQECELTGNKVPRSNASGVEGTGGAIGNAGILRLYRCTFSGNEGTQGGAIANVGGQMEIVNCTFSGNLATFRGGAIANNQPIYKGDPTPSMTVAFSTFTKNEVYVAPGPRRTAPPFATAGGGAIHNAGNVYLGNSIVAGNIDHRTPTTANWSPDGWSAEFQGILYDRTTGLPEAHTFHPVFQSFRGNVLGVVDAAAWNVADGIWGDLRFDQAGSELHPLDPLLADLAPNGGVPTHAPKPGSPALEQGTGTTSATFFDCPATDQRGFPRPPHSGGPNGERCDVGAYEAAPTSGVLEAELAERTGAFVIATDAQASGGQYVHAPNGAGDRTGGPDESQRIRFQVYVDAPGEYNIKGWGRAATATDNSFWVKVDGQPGSGYLWDLAPATGSIQEYPLNDRGAGTEGNPEVPQVRVFLSKGMHTVDVYLREDGFQLDRIQVVPAATPALSLEAESASLLRGAFMVGLDPQASAGKYVYTPDTYANTAGIPDAADKITTVVDVAQAGTYLIRANVHASFDTRNSFWVKVDGLPAAGYLWEMTESNDAYGLDYVSDRGNGNSGNPQFDPVEIQLSAGPHTIEIFAREGGTRLDRIGLESKQDADAKIISRNKPATSSSAASGLTANRAVDGNSGTRWASLPGDNQWIQVDLQARYKIHRVMLYWDAAYGRDYEIQISDNGSTWTSLYQKTGGTGGNDNLMLDGTGRYVRMKGVKQSAASGYSLKEFEVYGDPVPFVCQGACLGAQLVERYQTAVLNTTGERWFYVTDAITGWQASETAGRTLTVNGAAVQPGQMPLPPKVNGRYYFHFSPGTHSWASFNFWN